MLSKEDFISYIAGLPEKEPIALLAPENSDTEEPFYVGRLGHCVDEKPSANIMHNLSKSKRKGMTMFINYLPLELELGLMWRGRKLVDKLYYVKSRSPLTIGLCKFDQDGYHILDTADVGSNLNAATLQQKNSIERKEPRIQEAMEKPYKSRDMKPETKKWLGRGIGIKPESMGGRTKLQIDNDFIRIVMNFVNISFAYDDHKVPPKRKQGGNNIGAIMVDKDGKILAWGLNLKSENKTFHAETLMIQKYLRENNKEKLPDGVTIYTSLECCHMCASYISSLGKNVRVVYAQEDPFFQGKNSLSNGVNGCHQEPSKLPYVERFREAMGDSKEILDFLFSKDAKILFERGFLDVKLQKELVECVMLRARKMHIIESSSPGGSASSTSSISEGEYNEMETAFSASSRSSLSTPDSRFEGEGSPVSPILLAGEDFFKKIDDNFDEFTIKRNTLAESSSTPLLAKHDSSVVRRNKG